MILKEKFTLAKPRRDVWDFFMDIPLVSSCVPGASGVEAVDDQMYQGSLQVRVGPISANFEGKVTITEMEPPVQLVARVDGKDKRTASLISGTFTADLVEIAPDHTEVNCLVDVVVRGRLAQFGSTVMQATAREMVLAFVECAQYRFEAMESGAGESGLGTAVSETESFVVKPPSLLRVMMRAFVRVLRDALRRLRSGFQRTTKP